MARLPAACPAHCTGSAPSPGWSIIRQSGVARARSSGNQRRTLAGSPRRRNPEKSWFVFSPALTKNGARLAASARISRTFAPPARILSQRLPCGRQRHTHPCSRAIGQAGHERRYRRKTMTMLMAVIIIGQAAELCHERIYPPHQRCCDRAQKGATQ